MVLQFPRVMLAGIGSGCGKTTVTAAMLSAISKKGFLVQSYKTGPDYIDPMFHTAITKRPTYHLDSFFLNPAELCTFFTKTAKHAVISIIEGTMGFYDGIGQSSAASAYETALILKTPVILIVNPTGTARSLAALCKGFCSLEQTHTISGVILNHVKPGMVSFYRSILEQECNLPVLGYLPPLPEVRLHSRHLGLQLTGEITDLSKKLDLLGETALETFNLQAIFQLAQSAPLMDFHPISSRQSKTPFRLGIAQDAAFQFYYAENLELLQQYGAELIPISPLEDTALPDTLDGLYFGGGYPELYLPKLSGNTSFLEQLRQAAQNRMPILAECGGFLYLQEAMQDAEGTAYPLAGVLRGKSFLQDHLVRFGYHTVTLEQSGMLGKTGDTIRGHSFHYSDSTNSGNSTLITRPNGMCWHEAVHTDYLFAGYPHLYFPSNPMFAKRFADACKAYQKEQKTC